MILYYPERRRDEAVRFLGHVDACVAALRARSLGRGPLSTHKAVLIMPELPFNNAFVGPRVYGYEEIGVVPTLFTSDQFMLESGLPPDAATIACHEVTHFVHLEQIEGFSLAWNVLFGQAYTPQLGFDAWFDEGLAVYYETRLQPGAGRLAWPYWQGAFAAGVAGRRLGGRRPQRLRPRLQRRQQLPHGQPLRAVPRRSLRRGQAVEAHRRAGEIDLVPLRGQRAVLAGLWQEPVDPHRRVRGRRPRAHARPRTAARSAQGARRGLVGPLCPRARRHGGDRRGRARHAHAPAGLRARRAIARRSRPHGRHPAARRPDERAARERRPQLHGRRSRALLRRRRRRRHARRRAPRARRRADGRARRAR